MKNYMFYDSDVDSLKVTVLIKRFEMSQNIWAHQQRETKSDCNFRLDVLYEKKRTFSLSLILD